MPTLLRREELELEAEISVGSTAEAVWLGRSFDDSRWVAKKPLLGESELLAELVGWLLARAIEAPVPSGCGLWEDEQGEWWALSRFVEDASHWTPSKDPSRVRNLEAIGLLLAVDGILWNEDRHAKNILVANRDDCAVGIDFGAALVGHPPSLQSRGIAAPPRRRQDLVVELALARPSVAAGVGDGALRLARLDEREIAAIAAASTKQVCPTMKDLLQQVLEDRCRAAHDCNADLLGESAR